MVCCKCNKQITLGFRESEEGTICIDCDDPNDITEDVNAYVVRNFIHDIIAEAQTNLN